MTVVFAIVLIVFGFALGRRSARYNRAETTTVYAVRTGRDPGYVSVDLFRDRAEAEAFRDAQVPYQRSYLDGDLVFSTFQVGPTGPAIETEGA